MGKIIGIILIICATNAYAMIEPIKPIERIKPIWCQGSWVQVLVQMSYHQSHWENVCILRME